MKAILHRLAHYAPSAVAYFFVGGLCALIEWGTFFAAVTGLGLHYVLGVLAGFMVATFANWLLSSRFVFRSTSRSRRDEFLLVYAVSAVGLAINLAVTAAAIEGAGIGAMAAKVAGTGTAFVWNYLARQFFVFDRRTHRLETYAKLSEDALRHLVDGDAAEPAQRANGAGAADLDGPTLSEKPST